MTDRMRTARDARAQQRLKVRVEIPPPGSRTCANRDCWKLARPNGFFCSDACRARTWKERNPAYTSPPGERTRQNAAERRSRVSNGGLQVAYGKAERSIVDVLMGPPLYVPAPVAGRVAVQALVGALSDRQRRRWMSRKDAA